MHGFYRSGKAGFDDSPESSLPSTEKSRGMVGFGHFDSMVLDRCGL
jgi:hypothetical protein